MNFALKLGARLTAHTEMQLMDICPGRPGQFDLRPWLGAANVFRPSDGIERITERLESKAHALIGGDIPGLYPCGKSIVSGRLNGYVLTNRIEIHIA